MKATKQELLAENTELKRRLEETEETLEALVADGQLSQEILMQAEQAIAVCDRSGRIIRASRGLQQLCYQNPLLLPFQLAFPIKLPGNQPFLLAPLFKGKTLHNVEANFRRPDGRQVHVLVNAGPLLAGGEEIKGFVVAFTDITDRIVTEAEKQKLLIKLQTREKELQVQTEKLQVLNEELQVLNEELRVQTEELRAANQEILTAHKALGESEERLRQAQEAGRSGTFDWDLQSKAIILADNLLALFGLQAINFEDPYEGLMACLLPEDREATRADVQRALETGEYTSEFRIRRQDTGEIRWMEGRGQVFFDQDGKPARLIGINMDITGRKRMEEALRESEERYRSLFENNHAVMLIIDPETGDIVDVNPAACLYYGFSREELLTRKITDLNILAPEEVLQEMQRAKVEERKYFEFKHRLASGAICNVEVFSGPIRIKGQELLYSIVHDDTARKRAEAALRQAHDELEERVQERTAVLKYTVTQLQEEVAERQRAETELTRQAELVYDLYNKAPCGYHSLDPEGVVVQINDTELAWLGYTREEVVGRMEFMDLLTADSQKIFTANFLVLKEQGSVRDLEYHLIRKDGTIFPVLVSATAVTDKAGNYLISRTTVYDITERRRVEQNLRESQERLRILANQLLNAQEKERKRLAAELHDELGHALLTLKLSLGTMARKLLPEQESVKQLLQEQLEYINDVIEEVRRLYHDLSPGDLEDLGLSQALENLIAGFARNQPDITWQVDLPELAGRFPLPVQTIIYRLVQEALTNIGKHAEPTQVIISAREENRQVRLVIEDDGQGFERSEIDRDPNRGVGLAAMGERMYIVGGSLEIWSRKGEGTRLTFTIPTLREG